MPNQSIDIRYRVFHLGPECYIIYLGSDSEDENPFLRIGNIPDIPNDLHGITSRIIITSSFTGNPFQEVRYARKHKLSYLGDVDVIDHFRRFFQSLNLPSRELTDYRHLKGSGNRHTLYFYNNGNIHLNFDNQLLFDLQKREQMDLHCMQRCDQIKILFLKNPLRYTREELTKPAFFISDNGKFYLYHKEWMALDLENRYFSELASQGIDPDEVHAVFTHVPEESMTEDEQESLVQHIKRRVLRNRSLSILTTRPEIPEHLIRLFPGGNGTGQSPVKPVLLQGGGKWDHEDLHAEVLQDNLLIRFGRESDNTLLIPYGKSDALSVHESGWHVSADRKTLTWRSKDDQETELKTLSGYPLVLEKHAPDRSQLVEKYLGFLHSYLEAWKGRDAWQNLYALDRLVEEALENRGSPDSKVGLQVDTAETPGLEYLYLMNVRTLLNQADQDYSHLKKAIDTILQGWEKPSSLLPVLGDLYHGEKGPFILYRISTHKLNPHNFRKAEEISSQMIDLEIPDQAHFQSEKKRLQDLLDKIYSLQPSFREAQVVAKKKAPAFSKKPASAVEKKAPPAPSKREDGAESSLGVSDREGSLQDKRRSSFGATSLVKKPGRSRKSFSLPLLFLFLFLLLGAAAFGAFIFFGRPSGDAALMTKRPEKSGTDRVEQNGSITEPNLSSIESGPDSGNVPTTGGTSESNSMIVTPGKEVSANGSDTAADGPAGTNALAGRNTATEAGALSKSDDTAAKDNAETSQDGTAGTRLIEPDMAMDRETGTGDTVQAENGTPTENTTDSLTGSDETVGTGQPMDSRVGTAPAKESDGGASGPGPDTADTADASQSGTPVVETERRPQTVEEAMAYLQIEDIEITLVDIHLVSNAIAIRNGYHDLDYKVPEGNDPDWIWTGNTLVLPDKTNYTIVRGDSIWFIASRMIRRDVERTLIRLGEIEEQLDMPSLSSTEKQSFIDELNGMAQTTLSERLRSKIQSRVLSIQ